MHLPNNRLIPPGECAEYHALPESIKATTSYEQWQWLSGPEKGRLEQTETEPDYTE